MLVCVIWGMIGFQIYKSISNQPVQTKPKMTRVSSKPEMEQLTLSLKYNDPFFKKNINRKLITQKVRTPRKMIAVQPVAPVQWERVGYSGMIHNSTRQAAMAVITIDNQEFFVKEGASQNGFTVERISADSIKILFETQSRYIKRNKL